MKGRGGEERINYSGTSHECESSSIGFMLIEGTFSNNNNISSEGRNKIPFGA
jgi:hypothetical protein